MKKIQPLLNINGQLMAKKITAMVEAEEEKTMKIKLKTKINAKVFGSLGLMILKSLCFNEQIQDTLKIYGLLIQKQIKDLHLKPINTTCQEKMSIIKLIY